MNVVQWIMVIIAGVLGLSILAPYFSVFLKSLETKEKEKNWVDDIVIDQLTKPAETNGGLLEIVATWEHLTELLRKNKLHDAEARMIQIFPLLVVKENQDDK